MDRALPSTIAHPVDHELLVKKSRFLTHLHPVASVEEADAVVARRRKEHWDARHHCVALVVGTHSDQQRSTDDGEPSGTAGVPMLEVLRHREVTDVVAVVTRYFGGVLLGAGGLVRAYSTAVSEALDRALLVRRRVLTQVHLDVPHADAGRLDNMLRDWAAAHGAVLGEPQYGEVARLTLLVPPSEVEGLTAEIAATTSGALAPVLGAQRIADVPE
ncbi:YigZ family protein [Xylanimonas allomyrinae]|uniref:YigZ family protein n=1 Tax=Xylanimonas allomyrinae TaxID=2509459 RepID=A0A4V0YE17_9MICO|nr:YigZ family protein [Xylanimonas allomyrinae]QAY62651.1 YigZ family protein [Xylanimonas allomyrinae]